MRAATGIVKKARDWGRFPKPTNVQMSGVSPTPAAMLNDVLTMLGYAVQVARTGRDGISLVPEFRPDVVLLARRRRGEAVISAPHPTYAAFHARVEVHSATLSGRGDHHDCAPERPRRRGSPRLRAS
jgi:hypothetical protein